MQAKNGIPADQLTGERDGGRASAATLTDAALSSGAAWRGDRCPQLPVTFRPAIVYTRAEIGAFLTGRRTANSTTCTRVPAPVTVRPFAPASLRMARTLARDR